MFGSPGMSAPRQFSVLGGFLPNPRRISVEYHDSLLIVLPDLNHMTMQYGQFLSHDVEFQALTKGMRVHVPFLLCLFLKRLNS